MYQLGRDIEDEFSTLEDVSEALKTISKIPGRAFGGGKAKCLFLFSFPSSFFFPTLSSGLPPVIGLQIEGVGEVPLPLSEHDIARVTAVVDPCAENIQLEPSQVPILFIPLQKNGLCSFLFSSLSFPSSLSKIQNGTKHLKPLSPKQQQT